MSARPWCCPEPRCLPVFNVGGANDQNVTIPAPGNSIFCWGVMERPIEFVYDGVEHVNDKSLCVQTPLKGVVRFQVNDGDLGILATGMTFALDPEWIAEVRSAPA